MKKKRFWASASMTVEASFIVPFCFFAIFTVVYFCFYLANAATVTGVLEKNLSALTYDGGELPTRVGEIRGKITEDLNRSLLAVKSFEVDCKAEKDKVTAVVHGRVYNPVGIVKDMEFTVSDCVKRPDPVEFIRNVRRIKGLYDKGV